MRSIGRDPLFVARGEGAELVDVDGNRFIDYVCSWGPLIHGHAHPQVIAAIRAGGGDGHELRRADGRRVELAAAVVARMERVEMLRMTSSGTEASMTAMRLARAATWPRAGAEVRRRLSRPRRRAAGAGRLGAGERRLCPPAPACRRAPRRARWSCPGTTPKR